MGTITEKRKYTYEDYLKTPDDKRYELIEGDLLMTPSPNARHQEILMNLSAKIHHYVLEKKLGKVFIAPLDVLLGDNVVQPDLLFIAQERISIIGEKNIQGAPDLVVEILSENTAYRDAIQKKKLYARSGVKECWLVAPEDRLVEVYTLKDKGEYQLLKTYAEENVIESQVVKGLKIELSKVFA